MTHIRGSVPEKILTLGTAQIIEAVEERDHLREWSNSITNRIPEEWGDDTTQEAIIDRWLDTVEDRIRERDPAGYTWLFEGGPDPREDEEPVTR